MRRTRYIAIICLIMLLIIIILSSKGNAATDYATDENGITWAYTLSDGEATNVYYESGDLPEEVNIPSSLDGYPVVSLYNDSGTSRNIFTKINFGNDNTVKKVSIPSSVTSIGSNAFKNCIGLTGELVIPEGRFQSRHQVGNA